MTQLSQVQEVGVRKYFALNEVDDSGLSFTSRLRLCRAYVMYLFFEGRN